MSDSPELLKKAMDLRKARINEVFAQVPAKHWWRSTACKIQICKGFKNGRVIPCKEKHVHLYAFYYMNPFQRLQNGWRLLRGRKPVFNVYHFDPDWQSNREYMYDMAARGIHQPLVAVWFFKACLHPMYAHYLETMMEDVLKQK